MNIATSAVESWIIAKVNAARENDRASSYNASFLSSHVALTLKKDWKGFKISGFKKKKKNDLNNEHLQDSSAPEKWQNVYFCWRLPLYRKLTIN